MADSRLCTIPDCGKPLLSRGYCNMHYHRLRRFGPEAMPVKPAPIKTSKDTGKTSLFLAGVAFQYVGADCLAWPFGRTRDGYGKASYNGMNKAAHRIVCEVVHGPPPLPNYEASHLCGNACCVNPSHIRWATPKENTSDKYVHGTIQSGERHPNAKLTYAAVALIKSTKGVRTNKDIAAQFGVSPSTVGMVRAGYIWTD